MNQRLNLILSLMSIPSLILLMFGVYGIDKYINWQLFAISLILLGIVVGLIFSSILLANIKKGLNKKKLKELDKQNYLFKISLISAFIFFGGGVLLGESKSTIKNVHKYLIVKKGTSGLQKNRQYYIFISREGKELRYSFGKSTYELYDVGDTINLTLKSNLFGFNYFEPERWNK